METMFIKLFNMGMAATWLVLAVMVVRAPVACSMQKRTMFVCPIAFGGVLPDESENGGEAGPVGRDWRRGRSDGGSGDCGRKRKYKE